jgi:signal transduction histidine kinase
MLKTSPEIITTIILGVSLFMMLSIIVGLLIFRYKHNQQRHSIEIQQIQLELGKQLIQSQIEVQEATFASLGKEIHDNVGQLLSTTKMLLGITERQLPDPPDTLLTAHETLGKAIRELRNLSKSLTREWLEQFDLVENLSSELRRLEVAGELRVHFDCESRLPLSGDEQIILFRIIQESVQNVVKHARASTLNVSIRPYDDDIHISVKDDGEGFVEDGQSKGIGLMNMRHRIRLLKGTIRWISSPALGTEVLIQLPTQKLTP